MTLARPLRIGGRVTLVPLIDVLFILLVYFMVTSVYLDLDMIPASPEATDAPPSAVAQDAIGSTLLVRLDSTGRVVIQGRPMEMADLAERLTMEHSIRPGVEVVVLPSPRAPMQALASTFDAIAVSGVTRSRVLRLEAAE